MWSYIVIDRNMVENVAVLVIFDQRLNLTKPVGGAKIRVDKRGCHRRKGQATLDITITSIVAQ